SPAVSIRTCTPPGPRHACAGAGAGPTTAGRADPPFAYGSNRSGVTTTSASASSPFDFREQKTEGLNRHRSTSDSYGNVFAVLQRLTWEARDGYHAIVNSRQLEAIHEAGDRPRQGLQIRRSQGAALLPAAAPTPPGQIRYERSKRRDGCGDSKGR